MNTTLAPGGSSVAAGRKALRAELAERDVAQLVIDSVELMASELLTNALLIAKGAQQYEVMEHLGHTNIQTTINTYGHLFPSVRERIKVALEETWDVGEAAEAILGRGMQRDAVAPHLRPIAPTAGR